MAGMVLLLNILLIGLYNYSLPKKFSLSKKLLLLLFMDYTSVPLFPWHFFPCFLYHIRDHKLMVSCILEERPREE